MPSFLFCILLLALIALCFNIYRRFLYIRRLPPGPWGLPILGYLPWVDQNLYRLSMRTGEKYGPIFSFQLGQHLVVFLHSFEVAKEAFLKNADIFAGRPKLFWLIHTNKGNGIAITDGDSWKVIRRYASSSLRDFGMGKLSLEGKIHEEVQHMFEKIDAHGGQPFRATTLLANAVCNVICSVLYGGRFEYDDPLFRTLLSAATTGFGIPQSAILNWLPWLSHFPTFKDQGVLLKQLSAPYYEKNYDAIKRAEQHLDEGQKPTNFVEALVDEIRRGGARSSTLNDHCVYTINQIFLAAIETTAAALDWGLLLLILNPQVQRKMREEIEQVVGRERLPSWDDRSRLPYVEATMYEVLRLANIAAVPIPHRCTEDIMLRGYLIPKDTVVFSSMGWWAMDPENFPDPLSFKPERFLTSDGKVDYKKSMAPFGMGKRECVGEALAKMEMFNFLACLVQNYAISAAPGQKLEYLAGEKRASAWTTHSAPYEIVAVRC